MESIIASNVESALRDLLRKYGFTRGELELRQGVDLIGSRLTARQVPLLTWRGVRKFVELRNIIKDSTIENPCLLRFAVFSSKGDWSFKALLYRELDLIEYITGRRIVSVNACLNGEGTGNVIAITDNGILCS
ncbi:MAG TPA: hypothetical protein VGS79_09265, partial [Puia sp.]|nr:hypothetical protein [Puia sp.]